MIPFIDFGGSGLPLHFAHANGYPPACYLPLIERLKADYHVLGMLLRPLWPDLEPESLIDWLPLSDDLLRFLDEHGCGPVVGVGHSIGAIVTLRAALKAPERFRALVLLDPVIFPPNYIFFWNAIRTLGMGYRLHPLIPATLRRRREFDDLELIFRAYRRRSVFRYFSDLDLWAYIQGICKPKKGGAYELAYTPEWEARIYYTGVGRDMDLWRNLPRLKVPLLIIRGAETNTFWASTARRVRRKLPAAKIITLEESTHLFPLEKPDEVYQTMQEFLLEKL